MTAKKMPTHSWEKAAEKMTLRSLSTPRGRKEMGLRRRVPTTGGSGYASGESVLS